MLGLSLNRWVLCRRVSLGLGQNPGRVSSEDGAPGLCSASLVVSEHRARALVKSPPRRKLWWHGTGAGSGSHHHSHGTKPGQVAVAEEAVWCRNSCCVPCYPLGLQFFRGKHRESWRAGTSRVPSWGMKREGSTMTVAVITTFLSLLGSLYLGQPTPTSPHHTQTRPPHNPRPARERRGASASSAGPPWRCRPASSSSSSSSCPAPPWSCRGWVKEPKWRPGCPGWSCWSCPSWSPPSWSPSAGGCWAPSRRAARRCRGAWLAEPARCGCARRAGGTTAPCWGSTGTSPSGCGVGWGRGGGRGAGGQVHGAPVGCGGAWLGVGSVRVGFG